MSTSPLLPSQISCTITFASTSPFLCIFCLFIVTSTQQTATPHMVGLINKYNAQTPLTHGRGDERCLCCVFPERHVEEGGGGGGPNNTAPLTILWIPTPKQRRKMCWPAHLSLQPTKSVINPYNIQVLPTTAYRYTVCFLTHSTDEIYCMLALVTEAITNCVHSK